jgi:hypothetical protein
MTTEENNRTLGILHLVYGGMHGLIVLLVLFLFFPIFLGAGRGVNSESAAFFIIMMTVIGLFWLSFTIPSIIAGYGLLKRKSWVKIWLMIAGGLAGMSFPLGMALCAYTFWFWFSGGGRQLYEEPAQPYGRQRPGELFGAPQPSGWGERKREREREYTYVPPPEPPNWRGE